jgi:glutathione S-transferase
VGVPWWQAFLFRAGAWPVVRAVMRKCFHIEPGSADLALERLRSEFSYVSSLLADGRRYLVGDAFSGADLTFTALALPMLPIPCGAAQTFATARQPPVLQAAVDELAATPAGLFAARIWAKERQQVVG